MVFAEMRVFIALLLEVRDEVLASMAGCRSSHSFSGRRALSAVAMLENAAVRGLSGTSHSRMEDEIDGWSCSTAEPSVPTRMSIAKSDSLMCKTLVVSGVAMSLHPFLLQHETATRKRESSLLYLILIDRKTSAQFVLLRLGNHQIWVIVRLRLGGMVVSQREEGYLLAFAAGRHGFGYLAKFCRIAPMQDEAFVDFLCICLVLEIALVSRLCRVEALARTTI